VTLKTVQGAKSDCTPINGVVVVAADDDNNNNKYYYYYH
jgi:hypothetical protein